jgi:hypothetical protein
MKNLIATKYTCALMLLGSLVLGGCSEDINDFRKTTDSDASNEVYIDAKEQTINYTIVQTVNEGSLLYNGTTQVDTLWIKFPVHSASPVESDTKVSVLRDEELIDVYNAKNETTYNQFSSVFSTRTSITIPKGETISKDSISFAFTEKLSNVSGISDSIGQKTYLIPLRILTVSGLDTKIRYDERICYVVINVIQKVGVKILNQFYYIAEIPSGGTWSWNLPYTLSKPGIDSDIDVTLGVNNSLISSYNSENNTSYKPVSGSSTPISLTMGKKETSADGIFPISGVSSLSTGNYLVPLEITSVTGADGTDADNTSKVCYYMVRAYEQVAGSESVSINYTGSATNAEAGAALGYKQTDRSGYVVNIRNAATGLAQPPYSATYSVDKMVTDGTGYTYFNPSSDISLNVVIDLGKEVSNISGFELDGYSSTANRFGKSYDVGYATEAQYQQGKETSIGNIDNCLRYVYVQISPSITARYIILRNVKPALTSGTRYIGWSQFYIYTQN